MSKKCIYCGAELEDDALFCDECGKKQELSKEAETEQNAPKDAELKAKQEVAQRAKEEAEKQMREVAEAKLEAEKQAKAEEEAREEKEIRIKAEAEARVRVEAEQKERAEAQEKAEKKAAEEAEAIRLEKERKKEERKANPTYKAYASLIFGILTWVTSPTGMIPMITIPVGVFFGVQAMKSTKKKTALVGLVLNGIMVAAVIALMIAAK